MSPVSRRADANLTYPACRSTSTLWQGCSSSCTCGLGANITGYGGTTANSRLHHLAALERSAAHGCGRRGCASVADLVRGARLATDPHAKRCEARFRRRLAQAGGAAEHRPLRDSFSALRYLSTHPRLANVTEYYSAPENWPQWRQHTGHRFRNFSAKRMSVTCACLATTAAATSRSTLCSCGDGRRPRWGQAARSPRRQACPLSTRS